MSDTLTLARPVATSAPKFRHPYETFTWLRQTWDIARFWRELDAGRISPQREDMGADFVDSYGTSVLGLTKGKSDGTFVSLMMRLDLSAALALPEEAMAEPLVIVRARKGHGMLRLPGHETADHVLADGNHRLAKAFVQGGYSLSAYILSDAQSRKLLLR